MEWINGKKIQAKNATCGFDPHIPGKFALFFFKFSFKILYDKKTTYTETFTCIWAASVCAVHAEKAPLYLTNFYLVWK